MKRELINVKTGYFANTKSFTKVHLVDKKNDRPICNSQIKNKDFQINAYGVVYRYIECSICKKIAKKWLT